VDWKGGTAIRENGRASGAAGRTTEDQKLFYIKAG
jgi:hypothetical protein